MLGCLVSSPLVAVRFFFFSESDTQGFCFTFFIMMRLSLLAFLAVCVAQDMIITAVFDGPLTGGTPKGVELFVLNDIPDTSIMGISSANNGAASTGVPEFTFPSGSLTGLSFFIFFLFFLFFLFSPCCRNSPPFL